MAKVERRCNGEAKLEAMGRPKNAIRKQGRGMQLGSPRNPKRRGKVTIILVVEAMEAARSDLGRRDGRPR